MSSETRAPERPIRKANPNAHSHATNMQFAHRQNAHAVPPPSLLRRGKRSTRRSRCRASKRRAAESRRAARRPDTLRRPAPAPAPFPLQASTDVFPRSECALRCVACALERATTQDTPTLLLLPNTLSVPFLSTSSTSSTSTSVTLRHDHGCCHNPRPVRPPHGSRRLLVPCSVGICNRAQALSTWPLTRATPSSRPIAPAGTDYSLEVRSR